MNKNFSKKVEVASRKHEKKGLSKSRHCFIAGAEFVDKNSPKQFDEKDMFQILSDGVSHFAINNDLTVNTTELNKWFKKYMK